MLANCCRSSLLKTAPRAVTASIGAVRNLNVQEFVSMELMRSYGLPTPICYTASTPEEAEQIYHKLNPPNNNNPEEAAIIKAQVLTGGRGKGHFDNGFKGGVKFLASAPQAFEVAEKMLGANLITKQAPDGLPCNRVLLRECFQLEKELYVSCMLDRQSGGPLLVVCPSGGMSIEDVAENNPELIFTEAIDMEEGVTEEQCHNVAKYLELDPGSEAYDICIQLVRNLYGFFIETDSLLIEINPLAKTTQGKLVVADAKWVVDDRAEERQSHIFAKRDTSQEDPREVFASQFGLNYVGLDGDVGCLVNGAGLSMANMDLLELKGASPACFLDVGGAADQNAIDGALSLLQDDNKVKVIFINIFGGIVRCDLIAEGLIRASDKVNKPIVVRLEGNQADKGMAMLESSGIRKLTVEKGWDAAVDKVIEILNTPEVYADVYSYMMLEEAYYEDDYRLEPQAASA